MTVAMAAIPLEKQNPRAPLELRHLLFEHTARGIATTGVVIRAKAIGLFLFKGRSLVDGRTHRAIRILRSTIELDETARELHRVPPKMVSKACSKSAMRSLGSSSPTDRRISLSV